MTRFHLFVCASCLWVGFSQDNLFAQEDSNASIMANLDGNASELGGIRVGDSTVRRQIGTAAHPHLQPRPMSSSAAPLHGRRAIFHGPNLSGPARSLAPAAATRFEPFGLGPNQGGLSNSTFRVFGNGYGTGYSQNYFGNYGQGYGTGYSRNYFGNYGYGYGLNYYPKQ